MSKKSRFGGARRQLQDHELIDQFASGLDRLNKLCAAYDRGQSDMALYMSIEISKLLVENRAAIKMRARRTFTTPSEDIGPDIINATNKLTFMRLGGEPPSVSFMPFLNETPSPPKSLQFRDWWNKDLIYLGSTALPGTDPSMLPVNDSPRRSYAEREKLSRRRFIEIIRNTLAAHQSSELPEIIDILCSGRDWGVISLQTDQGMLSVRDGTLKVGTAVFEAMLRQISHEVLEAYSDLLGHQ